MLRERHKKEEAEEEEEEEEYGGLKWKGWKEGVEA
jgi:hypothetical protein